MSIVVVCQKCQFREFLKKWSLQVNSVTRQATFDRTKNCWKTPKLEKLKCDILGNCQHCEPWYLNMLSCLLRLKMRLFRDYNTLCFLLYSTTFISIEKHLKNKWHLPKAKKTNWEKRPFISTTFEKRTKAFVAKLCGKTSWKFAGLVVFDFWPTIGIDDVFCLRTRGTVRKWTPHYFWNNAM